jgi:NSS family neurotransmitter:Na+ symporter
MSNKGEFWSGRAGFILATIGAAIGLGSIWKFPYEVGANGGGAFLLCYVLGLGLVVFPLMLVEFAIGRRGRSDAIGSILAVAAETGSGRGWAVAGALGIANSFLVLSFYSVIGGWALAYAVETARDGLADGAQAIQGRYDALLASPLRMTLYHGLFMAVTAAVVARGVAAGIEAASGF